MVIVLETRPFFLDGFGTCTVFSFISGKVRQAKYHHALKYL